jgi:hypothetical protein
MRTCFNKYSAVLVALAFAAVCLGEAVAGAVGGQDLDSVLAIGSQKIRFESRTGRMVLE